MDFCGIEGVHITTVPYKEVCQMLWTAQQLENHPIRTKPPSSFFAYVSHLSENSYPFAVSVFERKPFNNLPSQGTKEKIESVGGCKLSRGGIRNRRREPIWAAQLWEWFCLHCAHKRIIHSVDVNYCLADNPLISSSVSFYTQAEISQKCLMALRYLIFNTRSSFPHRLVAFGLRAQADCSQSNTWVCGGQGAGGWRPAAWRQVS